MAYVHQGVHLAQELHEAQVHQEHQVVHYLHLYLVIQVFQEFQVVQVGRVYQEVQVVLVVQDSKHRALQMDLFGQGVHFDRVGLEVQAFLVAQKSRHFQLNIINVKVELYKNNWLTLTRWSRLSIRTRGAGRTRLSRRCNTWTLRWNWKDSVMKLSIRAWRSWFTWAITRNTVFSRRTRLSIRTGRALKNGVRKEERLSKLLVDMYNIMILFDGQHD